ncbi:hypothetical protein D3C77_530730 [compost metagenome]
MNGRSKILDDGFFILPQQNVQPQILLMQVSQQWRPVEAEQGGVEKIQVRLEQKESTDLAPFIEITEVIAQTHPEDKGARYLMGDLSQSLFPRGNVVKIGIELVEVLDMHEA